MANETQRNDRTEQQQQLLRIPTGWRQTSWLFTSAAGKLNHWATRPYGRIFSKTIKKTNFLQWAGLRHSIPPHLKGTNKSPSITALTFVTEYNVFDVMEKKSKDYCSLLVGKKAQPPYIVHTLKRNFNFSSDQIKHFFILPHRVALKSYVKAFQYKVLTSILYTNTKLHKIGFRPNDHCSFCKAQSETLSHFFYHCSHSRHF